MKLNICQVTLKEGKSSTAKDKACCSSITHSVELAQGLRKLKGKERSRISQNIMYWGHIDKTPS